jgi:hypothetical protein
MCGCTFVITNAGSQDNVQRRADWCALWRAADSLPLASGKGKVSCAARRMGSVGLSATSEKALHCAGGGRCGARTTPPAGLWPAASPTRWVVEGGRASLGLLKRPAFLPLAGGKGKVSCAARRMGSVGFSLTPERIRLVPDEGVAGFETTPPAGLCPAPSPTRWVGEGGRASFGLLRRPAFLPLACGKGKVSCAARIVSHGVV